MPLAVNRSKSFLPPDRRGRIFLFASAFFVSTFYLWRVQKVGFFVGDLNTGLSVFFFLSPLICLAGLIVQVIGVFEYIFILRRAWSPGLLLVIGLGLAAMLPVPPTPEEISFSLQGAIYRQIVELAKTNQLMHNDRCSAENMYAPPAQYRQLSVTCILVDRTQGLTVEFAPRSWERTIVYLEPLAQDGFVPCERQSMDGGETSDGRLFKQLNEHWFICQRWPQPRYP